MGRKTDNERNGYNSDSVIGRARVNDEVRSILADWPESVTPSIDRLAEVMCMAAGYLRYVISDENRAIMAGMKSKASEARERKTGWVTELEHMDEFPIGRPRPYGKKTPTKEEAVAALNEAIEISGPDRLVSIEAVTRMLGCNRDYAKRALGDSKNVISEHNSKVRSRNARVRRSFTIIESN